ncbi:MAG: oxidoreductase [Mucilaginibacter sp.]|nr:oxidoreductase [Mucilaginibacter sp.]
MRITIIGSGNVATHLAAAFKNAGHVIVQVYSRNIQNAALLAYHVKAEAIDDLNAVNEETDLFVIAVKDDIIGKIAEQLAKYQKLMVHTSGATDLYALLAFSDNAGVFYPLQTFSKVKEVDFSKVPLCIEGANETITTQLTQLAQDISQSVYTVNSEKRKTLHLAAVFACNFPNYLYNLAQQLLMQQGMEFDMLRPLILETAQKVQNKLPAQVQTGPAIRNDENTMAFHLQLLNHQPQLQQLYTLLSQGIIKLDIDERRAQ